MRSTGPFFSPKWFWWPYPSNSVVFLMVKSNEVSPIQAGIRPFNCWCLKFNTVSYETEQIQNEPQIIVSWPRFRCIPYSISFETSSLSLCLLQLKPWGMYSGCVLCILHGKYSFWLQDFKLIPILYATRVRLNSPWFDQGWWDAPLALSKGNLASTMCIASALQNAGFSWHVETKRFCIPIAKRIKRQIYQLPRPALQECVRSTQTRRK